MRPNWLIEANVEGLPSAALQAEILRQGMSVQVVKPFLHAPFPGDILGAEEIALDARVVFTGTLTLFRYIQRHQRWVPGGWCSFENLACSTYYAYFGHFLLNRNYAMLPIAEALREYERLGEIYSRNGQVFVRPDGVEKRFAGRLVEVESMKEFLAAKAIDPTTLVIVAEPKEIGREWRLFIAHGDIVTGSQYRVGGDTKTSADLPGEVCAFARQVLAAVHWRPDPLFVMDIGESQGQLKIVELNSFSCSGQCACDLAAYVAAASRSASLS